MVVQGRGMQRIDNAEADKEFQKLLKVVSEAKWCFISWHHTDLNPDEIGLPQVRAGSGTQSGTDL
jgi:hypothetical protein